MTNCDQGSLEAALAGGGKATFACSGVIALTRTISIPTDTVLDGTGQSVTISGNDRVRIFYVQSNVRFTMINLTLTHGNDIGAGADAQTLAGNGMGGALFVDGGHLVAIACQLSANQASGGTGNLANSGGNGLGGAMYNRGGTISLTNCNVFSNRAIGGAVLGGVPGVGYGSGLGGAVYNEGGTLVSAGTLWTGNSAQGAAAFSIGAGRDGAAFGGAVYSTNGVVEFRNCILSTNKTALGPSTRDSLGGATGGGAVYATEGALNLISSVLSDNECHGDSGLGSATEGNGGCIFNTANLYITNCTFMNNHAAGSTGRLSSKPGNGGAIYNLSNATVVGTTFRGNNAFGGAGRGFNIGEATPGGNGNGGAIYSTGTVALVNCTFFSNVALGGDGNSIPGFPVTSGGSGYGGAVFVSGGSFGATNLTIAENAAQGGKGGTSPFGNASDGTGSGGAVYVATGATATVVNTILANSLSGSNCFGALTDVGHNISSDASCNFISTGSLNNTDPKLGPFGNYGGPTATIPLLSGSPAIDAADGAACPAVDQRGISRPYGAGCDIGAFESAPTFTVNGHIHGYLSPAGVVVNVASNSFPVDESGFYTFTGLNPGTYVVTPMAPDTRFVPGRRVVRVGPDSTDVDFNAYRLNALTAETSTNHSFWIVYAGGIEGTYQTEISTNLIDWWLFSTNGTDTNGVFVITDLYSGSGTSTFLRVVKP